MLNEALKNLSFGWSVIPLKPHSKEPLIKWAEFQNRRASEAEVREWFAKCPTLNVGIVTGNISQTAVVDLDGPEGLETARKLNLSSSLTVITGNGRQLYYQCPINEIGNSVRLYPGLDIRAEGGYVVAPPSIHPSGKTYRWLRPLTASSVALLQPFPERLIAKAAPASTSDVSKNEPGWISTALENMTNGNIDDTLFKIAARLRNDGFTEADAISLLRLPAERAGATNGHLEDKIRNVWGRYQPKREMPIYSQIPGRGTLTLHSPSNPDSLIEFQRRMESTTESEQLRTGYKAFDTLSKGLKKGEVLTVAARTGVGKTNWVITPIRYFCEQGKRVLLFSTEMSFDQIWQRYTATLIDLRSFQSQQFFICDEFTPDIERIEEAIKNVSPDLFVFDHISHIGTDYHIISKFMSEIKRLARLYGIPAIVTAQLNRNADYVEQGARIEPRLSMIQGSDQIGQMSAQVLLLNEKRINGDVTEIEGIIVKNRHGDRGMIQFGLVKTPYYRMIEL